MLASAAKQEFCERTKCISASSISHANTILPPRTAIATNAKRRAVRGFFAWMQ